MILKNEDLKMETGLLIRGMLVGTKPINDGWKNKDTGVWTDKHVTVIGVEVDYVNGFGRSQTFTREVQLFDTKLNDAAFMKSINDNCGKLIELPCFVNYGKLVVENSAVLIVLNTPLERVS
jgi:hypothetical protein